jgi:hypothetical protein
VSKLFKIADTHRNGGHGLLSESAADGIITGFKVGRGEAGGGGARALLIKTPRLVP